MRNGLFRGSRLLLLLWLGFNTVAAVAAERWQLLVLPQASETLPADHPAYRSVERAIIQELKSQDIDAFSPSLVGVELPCGELICPGMSEADLIVSARGARRPLDMLVLFSIRVVAREFPMGTKYAIDVPVTLINLENGDHFYGVDQPSDNFEFPPAERGKPAFVSWLTEQARRSSAESYVPLTNALTRQARRFVFRLDFQRIPVGQAEKLSRRIRRFEGAVDNGLVLLSEGDQERQLLHRLTNLRYTLRSELDGAALREAIGIIVDDIGIAADVTYQRGNRQLTVSQTGLGYLNYYIGVPLALLLFAYGLYVVATQRRIERQMHREADAGHVRNALGVMATTPWLVPKRPSWQRHFTEWDAADRESKKYCEQANQCLHDGQYPRAVELLEQSLQINADCSEATPLLERARYAIQARELLANAESCWEEDPAECLQLLERARALSSDAVVQVDVLSARANRALRSNLVDRGEVSAEKAIAAGNYYVALAAYDQVLEDIRGLSDFVGDRARIQNARDKAAEAITVIRTSARGRGALEGVDTLLADTLQVGRSRTPVAGAIALHFNRLSRLGKHAAIERRGSEFLLRHIASKNGVYVDDNLLKPDATAGLADGAVVAMGGQVDPPKKGACQLRFIIPPQATGSAWVSIEQSPVKLLSRTSLVELWPTADADMSRSWLLLGERLPFTNGESGGLRPASNDDPVLFELGVVNGALMIAPGPDAERGVTIDDSPCRSRVPVAPGAMIRVNDYEFSFTPPIDEQEATQ